MHAQEVSPAQDAQSNTKQTGRGDDASSTQTTGKLRNRFALIFTAAALVPLLVMGGVAVFFVNQAHRQDINALEEQLLAWKSEEIEKFLLADTVGILQIRVGYDAFEIPDQESQAFLLRGILTENEAIQEVSFVAATEASYGEETARMARGADGSLRPVAGRNVASYPEAQEMRVAFRAVRETKDSFIGSAGAHGITVAAPVVNQEDELIGAIIAIVEREPIAQRLAGARLGAEGYAYLLDGKQTVVAHTAQTERFPETVSATPDGFRYEGVLSAEVFGKRRALAVPGWALVVEWPVADAQKLVYSVSRQVALFAVVALVLMVGASVFVARRIAVPIQKLLRGTAEVKEGNFAYHIEDVRTGDELEMLAQAFNRMSDGLKQLMELKNEFVFIAAHELRTPVTAIKGFLELVFEDTKGKLDPAVEHSLKRVGEANDRLIQLVNDLLEIARSEAGRITIEVSPQDITEAVREVYVELEPLAKERGIAMHHEVPEGDVPEVLADPGKLKEILVNFVSNAIKYNRDGGSITITHQLEDGILHTSIADTGIGMSGEDLAHLFEKFWRSERREVHEQTGTGLGMFIVKELVERMGGKVWAESEVDKGTTFHFTLPVVG